MIRIGILGYGNLGKGVENALKQNSDMKLVAIFTRRNPNSIKTYTGAKVINIEEIENWKDKIDVMILCGGSATDLPKQAPKYAKMFNIIDSYDTHNEIPKYYDIVNKSALEGNKVAIISIGWDPGLFSLNRLISESILPEGETYTFWGKGVSQGHSDAIRKIDGVKDAIQYTIPIENAVERVRNGENPKLSTREKHLRDCFVVLKEGADKKFVEKQIKTMPNYFAEYDTIVHFISEEELIKNHTGMPHGGFVIRSGNTGYKEATKQIIEYSLKLESNPEFTASVLLAYARAANELYKNGEKGVRTIFDIPPKLLTKKRYRDLLKEIL